MNDMRPGFFDMIEFIEMPNRRREAARWENLSIAERTKERIQNLPQDARMAVNFAAAAVVVGGFIGLCYTVMAADGVINKARSIRGILNNKPHI